MRDFVRYYSRGKKYHFVFKHTKSIMNGHVTELLKYVGKKIRV